MAHPALDEARKLAKQAADLANANIQNGKPADSAPVRDAINDLAAAVDRIASVLNGMIDG